MKKIILKNTIAIVIILAMFLVPQLLMAQAPGFDDDIADVPIDGGLSILLAAGAGIGLKKIRDNRKK